MESENEGDAHDLRIVLLGVSGAGKSSMGNAILGREAFKESRTRESEIQRGRVEDRNISIIDTPGFFNTQLTDEELQKQMMKGQDLSDPGPHVFLLIVNLENFKEDERNIVEEIEEIFGAEALKFTMVLFTGRERMSNKEWNDFTLSEKFQGLVSNFREQYHEINSKDEIDQTHIKKLLMKIDEFIEQNDGQHYNNKSTKEKKKQEEEKKYRKKEQERPEQVLLETFEMNSAMEEKVKHAVFEPENVRQRKKTTDEEANLQRKNSLDRFLKFSSQEKQKQGKIRKISQGKQTTGKKHLTQTGLSRCWVLTTVCLVLICVLLLVAITLQHSTITEQRDLLKNYKNTVEELNQTINSLQDNFNDLTTEKDQWHQFTKILVMSDLRIMVVGKTGAGKSASGNTILKEKVFEENFSAESVTKTCQKHQRKVKRGSISVIDTPGLFDTKISEKQLKDEIEKCVNMSVPGPHVFLLVIRLDVRFTDEEKKTVKWIQENFGEKAADYSIILFTRGDQIEKPIEEFLTENRQIEELVRQCKSRYHVFNNKDKNSSQVNELLDKIVRMVMENGGEHYTNEMYKEALKRQREEQERQRLEEEKKIYKEALERKREEDERQRLEEEEKMYKEALERQREEDERRRLEEEEKMYKEALERQREEDERRRLEEEEKMYKEALERQREEDERQRLEEEEKMYKEALERQREEDERQRLEEEEKMYKEALERQREEDERRRLEEEEKMYKEALERQREEDERRRLEEEEKMYKEALERQREEDERQRLEEEEKMYKEALERQREEDERRRLEEEEKMHKEALERQREEDETRRLEEEENMKMEERFKNMNEDKKQGIMEVLGAVGLGAVVVGLIFLCSCLYLKHE